MPLDSLLTSPPSSLGLPLPVLVSFRGLCGGHALTRSVLAQLSHLPPFPFQLGLHLLPGPSLENGAAQA